MVKTQRSSISSPGCPHPYIRGERSVHHNAKNPYTGITRPVHQYYKNPYTVKMGTRTPSKRVYIHYATVKKMYQRFSPCSGPGPHPNILT